MGEIAIWIVCVAFLPLQGPGAFAVASMLVAFCAICACEIVPAGAGRAAVKAATVAFCCLCPDALPFLPVAACLLAAAGTPWVRMAWVAGWLVAAVREGLASSFPLLLVCCAAAMISWRASLSAHARRRATIARDSMREQAIELADEMRDLSEAVKGVPDEPASAADARCAAFDDLTEREADVCRLVAEGLDNKEIAARLFLSEGTVRNHISAVLAKKQLKNRTQIAVLYYRG